MNSSSESFGSPLPSPIPAAAAPPAAPLDRRETILITARRLWGQLGYHTVSLRRIADEAGVTLSLIDHHFGAKHALFASTVLLLSDACESAREKLAREPAKAADERFVQLAAALLDPVWQAHQSAAGRNLLGLWMRHRHETLPEVRLPLERAVRPLLGAVADALCKGRPHADRSRVETHCHLVFCDGVELLAADHHRGRHEADINETPRLGFQELLTRMTMRLRFGLADIT